MKMPMCQLNIIKPVFIKWKEKLLKETGVIKTIEVLIHDSISEIGEVLEGAELFPLCQMYIF